MNQQCTGNGLCIIQCDRRDSIHRHCSPNGCYINNNCEHDCELRPCNNFVICRDLYPQWYLDCHNGCCQYCNMFYGKITFLDDEPAMCCSMCNKSKKMIKVQCGQKCCLNCYRQYCKKSNHNKCPLCDNPVWGIY